MGKVTHGNLNVTLAKEPDMSPDAKRSKPYALNFTFSSIRSFYLSFQLVLGHSSY